MKKTEDTTHQLFRGQKLTNEDFSGQDLTGSNFRECQLIRCNFDDTLLYYCNFKDATITDCTFKGAKGRYSAWLPKDLPGLDMKTEPIRSELEIELEMKRNKETEELMGKMSA
jgi:uncharacterized protein YjbI with pentapeptide repeats